MSRSPDFTRPDHPALVGDVVVVHKRGADRPAIRVQCPKCSTVRVLLLANVRQALLRGAFTGRCQLCKAPSTRTYPSGRRKLRNGYIQIFEPVVPAQYLNTFRALNYRRGKIVRVLEHEFWMVIMIGRALLPREVVGHRNGIRSDNRPDNLRLFINVRGRALEPSPIPMKHIEEARAAYAMIASTHA